MGALASVRNALMRPLRQALIRAALPLVQEAYFEGARSGRRMGNLRASTVGPNSAVGGSAVLLRNRARDLVANNAWACNAEESFVANFVGTGIVPRLNLPGEPEKKEEIQRVWKWWTDEADASGALDFYGLQQLAARGYSTGGEVLVRRRDRQRSDGLVVPLQLQILEPDHLDSGDAPERWNGNRVEMGIEYDRMGRRVAYHLSREHPGDQSVMSAAGGFGTVRVPADQICHVFNVTRPGQRRGVSRLASMIVRLHMLDSYEDATMERNRQSANFLAFIKKMTGGADFGAKSDTTKDDFGNATMEMQPGIIAELGLDEDITWSQPPGAEASFESWCKHELRACAAGVGMTYEQLTGDYSGGNYSRTRAALLEFRRRCEMLQHHIMVFQLCRPVWAWFMDAAALNGVFKTVSLAEYRARRREFLDVQWIPPHWQWLDPVKDANGEVILVDNNLKAPSQTMAELGFDAEEVYDLIAEDQERRKRKGIADKSKAPAAAAAAPEDDKDDDEEDEDGKEAKAA
jgi:lambda family phage portal protein